jgi:NAD(P)-dependent dehydrogenase (short-subunit alcohol dehydrogenase family)
VQTKGAQHVLVLYRQSLDFERIRQALVQIWAEDANRLLIESLQLPDHSATPNVNPLEEYLAKRQPPDVVFYFSGVIDDILLIDRELQCILGTAQSFIDRAGTKALQFYYCYPEAQSAVRLYQEGLSGLFRAVALECPAHRYRSVEYPCPATLQDCVAIVQEWLLSPTTDTIPAQLPMVRYRGGKRYITALKEKVTDEGIEIGLQFRPGANYLMVGALGEVGQIVCRALAQAHGVRLVFLSRRPIDDRIRKHLASLSDAGAQVYYRSVDVTDEDELTGVFGEIKKELGDISGVFHLARSVADGPLHSKSFASFQQTIAAKVRGTLLIDKITAHEPLDFFCVFSSMASFGIEGSADYGYATAFQNAFVRDRNLRVDRGERSGRSVALCWGQWQADAYLSTQRRAMIEQSGFDFIDEASAWPLIETGLRQRDEVQGIIAVKDKQRVKSSYGLLESDSASHAAEKKPGSDPARAVKALIASGHKANGKPDAIRNKLQKLSFSQLVELRSILEKSNGAATRRVAEK